MEETIYNRQIHKLGLSQRVVDTENPERHFTANELDDLYSYRVLGQCRAVAGHGVLG